MKELFNELYGNYLTKYEKIKVSLPNYLIDNRELYSVTIFDFDFLLVYLKEDVDLVQIKKQHAIYKEQLNKEIVFGFDVLLTRQRKSLIREFIPFVSKNEQVFLPFLGSYFNKCIEKKDNKKLIKFQPITQLLFLYIFYSEIGKKFSKKEIAALLKTSPMSITRATRELVKADLIKEVKSGTASYIWSELEKVELYEKAKEYLINPVMSYAFVDNKDVKDEKIICGEYALSMLSNLAYTKNAEYALFKDNTKNIDLDNQYIFDSSTNLIKIEKWKYDPVILSSNNIVDPISLILSLKEINDERVKMSLTELEKEIFVWKIEF